MSKRVRGRVLLSRVDEESSGVQLTFEVTVECEGQARPVCVAQFLIRRY